MYFGNNSHRSLMICKHCLLMAYFLSNASVHFIYMLNALKFFFFNFLILRVNSVIVGPIYICPAISYYWIRHV